MTSDAFRVPYLFPNPGDPSIGQGEEEQLELELPRKVDQPKHVEDDTVVHEDCVR